MTSPHTTIGISIYRQPAHWVSACIASAQQQSDAEIEIIIRPDGPEALSPALHAWLRDRCTADPRLRLLDGIDNLGTFGSYRSIFARARGTFLAQLDADDLLHHEAIARCRSELEQHPELAFLYTNCLEIDADNNPMQEGLRQRIPYSTLRSFVQFIPFHLRLVRRSAYEKAGGYSPRLLYTGDYDLSLRLAEVGAVGHLPLPLYLYRVHAANTSGLKRQATVQEALEVARDALRRRGLDHRYALRLDANQQMILLRLP